MKIIIRERDGVVILDLEGNITIDASNLIETIGEVLKEKTKDIVCNFEGVNVIDYVGVSLVAVMYKNVLNQKGRIKLYNVPVHVAKLFAAVGLNKVFEYYSSEDEAVAEIKKDKRTTEKLKQQLRRKFKRIPFKAVVEYKQSLSKDFIHKGTIVNLSAKGALVSAEHVFSFGDLLIVRLHLMPGPGVIEVNAKVVWIDEDREIFEGLPEMGLEFYDISTEKQRQIIQFVERHLTHSSQQ